MLVILSEVAAATESKDLRFGRPHENRRRQRYPRSAAPRGRACAGRSGAHSAPGRRLSLIHISTSSTPSSAPKTTRTANRTRTLFWLQPPGWGWRLGIAWSLRTQTWAFKPQLPLEWLPSGFPRPSPEAEEPKLSAGRSDPERKPGRHGVDMPSIERNHRDVYKRQAQNRSPMPREPGNSFQCFSRRRCL